MPMNATARERGGDGKEVTAARPSMYLLGKRRGQKKQPNKAKNHSGMSEMAGCGAR